MCLSCWVDLDVFRLASSSNDLSPGSHFNFPSPNTLTQNCHLCMFSPPPPIPSATTASITVAMHFHPFSSESEGFSGYLWWFQFTFFPVMSWWYWNLARNTMIEFAPAFNLCFAVRQWFGKTIWRYRRYLKHAPFACLVTKTALCLPVCLFSQLPISF